MLIWKFLFYFWKLLFLFIIFIFIVDKLMETFVDLWDFRDFKNLKQRPRIAFKFFLKSILKIKPMSFACLRFEIFTLFCFCWATN